LQDGLLRLRCDSDFSSGEISSVGKYNFRYGYIEARAKVPLGAGFWPAGWTLTSVLLQNTWQEIDWFEEHGNHPERHYYNVHSGAYPGPDLKYSGSYGGVYPATLNLSTAFHRYGVDWHPTGIDFFFDDILCGTFQETQFNAVYDYHHLLFSFSISEPGSFGGTPASNFPWPAWFDIDYIGIWKSERHRAQA